MTFLNKTSANECRDSVTEHLETGGTVQFVFAYLLPAFACVGLIGNALTIFALSGPRHKESKKTSLFLSSKAAADFGVGLFTILFNLNAYDRMVDSDSYSRFYYHKLLKPVFAIVNWLLMSSTWYAVAVTFERMFAIRWPLRARHTFTTTRIGISITCIAVLSLLVTAYPIIMLRNVTFVDCQRPWRHVYANRGPLSRDQPALWYYGIISRSLHNILASVVPVILLLVFNVTIVFYLRIHSRSLARFTDAGYNLKDAGEQVRISFVVLAITAATAVFLLPSAAVAAYDAVDRSRKPRVYQAFVIACNLLVLCDKVLDFFLYCLVSGNFRKRLAAACCEAGKLIQGRRKSSGRSQDTAYLTMSVHDGLRRGSRDTVRSRPSLPL